jgi:hypothetical protein
VHIWNYPLVVALVFGILVDNVALVLDVAKLMCCFLNTSLFGEGPMKIPELFQESPFCGNVEGMLCNEDICFLQKRRLLYNLYALQREMLLHILFPKCHAAKPMRFLKPNRGSSALPKNVCRLSMDSLPLESEGFVRP